MATGRKGMSRIGLLRGRCLSRNPAGVASLQVPVSAMGRRVSEGTRGGCHRSVAIFGGER